MIDFKNSKFVKMKKDKAPKLKDVSALLIPGEQVLGSYTAMRDYVVFTDKRVISVAVLIRYSCKTGERPLKMSKNSF